MRKYIIHMLAGVLLTLVGTFGASAAEKIEAGARGGRLLETESPRPEFFVEKDRTVSIAFYDEKKKRVPAGSQEVTAIAEAPGGTKKLEFEKKGDLLVSKAALPEGEGYTVVVQYRSTADARPKNFRIPLILDACGECKLAEYACICGH